ncbi:MAG: vgr related protein [Sphingorhabdus sp.]
MFGAHSSGRALTIRERGLAQGIFGDALHYEKIRIHNRKWWWFQPKQITMAPDGHLWFHPGSDLFCTDFCDQHLGLQGHFIHELVHVWQHQRGIFLPLKRHPFCRYDYSLKPGWKLEKYGIEQQAEIVRHVFLLRHGEKVVGAPPLSQYEDVLPF